MFEIANIATLVFQVQPIDFLVIFYFSFGKNNKHQQKPSVLTDASRQKQLIKR